MSEESATTALFGLWDYRISSYSGPWTTLTHASPQTRWPLFQSLDRHQVLVVSRAPGTGLWICPAVAYAKSPDSRFASSFDH